MALITQDEYKAFANIEGNKTNAQIDSLIEACSGIVENLLGYSYNSGTTETIICTFGRNTYFLENPTVTTPTVKFTPKLTKVEETLTEDDYFLESSGKLTIVDIDIKNYDKILVTSTIDSTVPEEIKLATMLLVRYYMKDEFNKTSIGSGGQQVSYISGNNLPPHVRTLIIQNRVM